MPLKHPPLLAHVLHLRARCDSGPLMCTTWENTGIQWENKWTTRWNRYNTRRSTPFRIKAERMRSEKQGRHAFNVAQADGHRAAKLERSAELIRGNDIIESDRENAIMAAQIKADRENAEKQGRHELNLVKAEGHKAAKLERVAELIRGNEILELDRENAIVAAQIKADRERAEKEQQRGVSTGRIQGLKDTRAFQRGASLERDKLMVGLDRDNAIVAAQIKADRERAEKEQRHAVDVAAAQGHQEGRAYQQGQEQGQGQGQQRRQPELEQPNQNGWPEWVP